MSTRLDPGIEKEICDVLGLKYVRTLNIHFSAKNIPIVTAEMFIGTEQVKNLTTVLRKFKLVPIEEQEESDINYEGK